MISHKDDPLEEMNKRSRRSSIETRGRESGNKLVGLEMEKEGLIKSESLIDNCDIITSSQVDSIITEYEINLNELKWDREESKPINELILKRGQ